MKKSNFLSVLTIALLLASGAVGCKKAPKNVTPIQGTRSNVPGGNTTLGNPTDISPGSTLPTDNTRTTPVFDPNDPSRTGVPVGSRPGENMTEDAQRLKAETVYFDFDKSAVRQSEASKVEAVATFLKNEPTAMVRVEGNCDERGTEEYNRSLGERRSLAVQQFLVNLGIAPERITTVSYGEDRPAEMGQDEAAYAKNRRVDFVVLTPKQ
ncbi:MAG: peptidoglycan-associated lipoprotein Pal [Verrucomicrobiota bacterium]|nr:peptidoglycan-associated lipoprotein Pal [Verrucomicrobiota bacterium]